MYWFLLLLVPTIIRSDVVLRPPNIVLSQVEWDAKQWHGHPMWGGQQVQYGPERQMEWNIKMVLMHLPFLIIALCGYFR